MIGVTIGIGDGFREDASAAAEAASRFLGLSDVLILDESHLREHVGEASCVEDIYRLKFFIPTILPDMAYVYFDSDWRIRRKPPMELDALTICAVRDRPYAVPKYFPTFQFDYANAGFYVMPGRFAGHVASWCLRHACVGDWAEQTTWNRAIRALGLPVRWLNRTMNWMPLRAPLAIAVDPVATHGKATLPLLGVQPNVQAMVEHSTPNLLADGWTTDGGAWVHDGERQIVFRSDGTLA